MIFFFMKLRIHLLYILFIFIANCCLGNFIMSNDDNWPTRVNLVDDVILDQNKILKNGLRGSLVRAEIIDRQTYCLIDFGREGLLWLESDLTNLSSKVAAENDQLRSNLMHYIAPRVVKVDRVDDKKVVGVIPEKHLIKHEKFIIIFNKETTYDINTLESIYQQYNNEDICFIYLGSNTGHEIQNYIFDRDYDNFYYFMPTFSKYYSDMFLAKGTKYPEKNNIIVFNKNAKILEKASY